MFSLFSKSAQRSDIPDEIYGTVMARSRNAAFFRDFGIDDSVMGRFGILSLHVYLLARRMKQEGTDVALSLSQDVFDLFVSDVERALRELGIGDTSVPKKKKKMVRSFYGQIEDFDTPLNEANCTELRLRVEKRFYDADIEGNRGENLAAYIFETNKALSEMNFEIFCNGEFFWPDIKGIMNT